MGNFRNLSQGLLYFAVTLGLTVSLATPLSAKNPNTIPTEVKEAIAQIEGAANRQDIEAVMSHYSKNFTNSDGLDRSSFSEALKNIWQGYPSLKYTTEIKSWEKVGDRLVVVTETSIDGSRKDNDREFRISGKIRSRQHFLARKIVKQEVLAERTQISTGTNPPELIINLPEKVRIGQKFHFDAIVKEPLEDEVLLGGATQNKASSAIYFQPSNLELQTLPAGGIFKIVQAPLVADSILYSVIIARSDGITIVTQRVAVED